MLTVKDYINELDTEMAKTLRHIDHCNRDLLQENIRDDNLKSLNHNLNNSLKRKKKLHDEIVGMIDYEDEYGSNKEIINFGWQRWIPLYMKGNRCWVDSTAPSSAQEYGFDDNDFRYPWNC